MLMRRLVRTHFLFGSARVLIPWTGCVLYHYGLTQFKVFFPHPFKYNRLTSFSTTLWSSVSPEVSQLFWSQTEGCNLTWHQALGCITQLVWARGGFKSQYIAHMNWSISALTALGLPLERPKCNLFVLFVLRCSNLLRSSLSGRHWEVGEIYLNDIM